MGTALEKKMLLAGRRVRLLGAPDGLGIRRGSSSRSAEPALVAFVRSSSELARVEASVVASAAADRMTWVAYPKAGQLGTDLNRDRLWQILEARGIRPVTSVAIDSVWTALRFRPSARAPARSG